MQYVIDNFNLFKGSFEEKFLENPNHMLKQMPKLSQFFTIDLSKAKVRSFKVKSTSFLVIIPTNPVHPVSLNDP